MHNRRNRPAARSSPRFSPICLPDLACLSRYQWRSFARMLRTASYGASSMSNFLRVTIGTQPEMEKFLIAFREIAATGSSKAA